MTPTVSIVIPCFNLGAYVDEAVASVLAQTVDDVEIIVVDDGSDEVATRHLFDSFDRPKTEVVRVENGGLAAARNVGLERTTGRYVSFLDADDVLVPTFLERLLGRFEDDPELAFASCWLTAFGEDQFAWTPERCDFPRLLAECTVCTAALTRRDAIDAVGGYDGDERLGGHEDWELAIRLVDRGYRGAIVPESLFRYRIRAGSMSSWCNAPDHHAGVFAALLDRYAESYERHAAGVAAEIVERIGVFEATWDGDPPARPAVDASGPEWRSALEELERHRRWLEAFAAGDERGRAAPTALDAVAWGTLRRTQPVSRIWGLDRGTPINRRYIEQFLDRHAAEIRGDVLEVKDPAYTHCFQRGAGSVTVVDIARKNEHATLHADLTELGSLPPNAFDCAVITQTLHEIFDVPAALRNLHRALAPGGVVLATLPCTSRIDYESGIDGDQWRFTPASAQRMFGAAFGDANVDVESFGNVLTCTAFLHGIAAEELTELELQGHDRYFPLLVAVRAEKPVSAEGPGTRAVLVEGHVDEVTCGSVSGWAWNAATPAQRLRLEVRADGVPVGSAWADRARDDLAEAGKTDGTISFGFSPDPPRHLDPASEITVVAVSSGLALTGARQPSRCDCDAPGPAPTHVPVDSVLAGAAVDTHVPGGTVELPGVELVGWAIGASRPVDRIELRYRGDVFATLALSEPRPDLVGAFPDHPWAARSGFRTRLNLLGVSGTGELEVVAVFGDGVSAPISMLTAVTPAAVPAAVVLLDCAGGLDLDAAVFAQQTPPSAVLVTGSAAAGPLGHPGLRRVTGWNQALDGRAALLWLTDGTDEVTPEFLARAGAALGRHADASFAVALEPGDAPPGTIVSALSGRAAGAATIVRASAAHAVGGFDEGAPCPAAASWDLVIRLVDAGHRGASVAAASAGAVGHAGRLDEAALRWLYRKHADAFIAHLPEVLLDRETRVAGWLRANHLAERTLTEDTERRLRARRAERGRLGRKLRPGTGGARRTDWADFHRFAPVSPLWGEERGLCVDRHYIEQFLAAHAADIHGDVLAFADGVYAERYGGERVDRCDVIDSDPANPEADHVGRFSDVLPPLDHGYDCAIVMHALQLEQDPAAALAAIHARLKPGGVLLTSAPSASRPDPANLATDRWRFSAAQLAGLLDAAFGPGSAVEPLGNRAAIVGFLAGLAAAEIGEEALDATDPAAPLLIVARGSR